MFREMIASVLLKLYPHRFASGIQVIFTDLNVSKVLCLGHIDAALGDLAIGDPRWRRWIKSNVPHIIVWPGHITSADRLGGFQIASSLVADPSSLLLASVLIHEAVHVRVTKHGIPFEGNLRERIERLCTKEQVRFLRQSGEYGGEMAEHFEAALTSPWWTDEAQRRDAEQVAANNRLPRWVVSLLTRRG